MFKGKWEGALGTWRSQPLCGSRAACSLAPVRSCPVMQGHPRTLGGSEMVLLIFGGISWGFADGQGMLFPTSNNGICAASFQNGLDSV